ncbi:MAG: GTP-binding protein [Actinomycetota bacterium]
MVSNNSRIPVTMVAGWHGSGKSAFVERLTDLIGTRTCAVVASAPNETGDGRCLLQVEDEVVEQVPGCRFCAVRHDLVYSLRSLCLGVNQPARILVELSGWADPAVAAQTLLGDPYLAQTVELDALVTVVDASALYVRARGNRDPWPAQSMGDQVALADIVLVNRTQELTATAGRLVQTLIAGTNPLARIVENHNGLDLSQFFDLHGYRPASSTRVSGLDPAPSTAIEGAVSGLVVELTGRLDRARFEHWAASLDHDEAARILRIVGPIYVAGDKYPLLCHRVGTHLALERTDRWSVGLPGATRLFVSGRGLTREMVLDGLQDCLTTQQC